MQTAQFDAKPFAITGLEGQITFPADAAYDTARTIMYGGTDWRPAAIVRVASAADVARTITFARESGREIAVRSGGHSAAGHSSTDGGIVIDLRSLNSIDVDPVDRTAWAGSGATAGAFTAAAAPHGLAVGFGDTGSVGLGGITLGGGVGYLVRKYGLTIDSLLAAEIVLADGRIVTTDAENEPDLFWAIRGGGGNFGVATRFKFRLQPLAGAYGGLLILPANAANIAGFIAAAEAASEDLSTIANIMPAPPMPFLPAALHGKPVIFGMLAFAGDAADGEAAVRPFRELDKPLADMMRPMQLADFYPPEDPDYHPTAAALTMFMDRVDVATAELILDRITNSDASMRVTQLRVLGGAASRVAPDATAYAHRGSRIMVNIAAFYVGAADRLVRQRWVADFAASLRQEDQGVYVNFLGDEGAERVLAAYPGKTWDRLRAIKARFDPANVFRRNQNIPPAVA